MVVSQDPCPEQLFGHTKGKSGKLHDSPWNPDLHTQTPFQF